MKRRLSFAEQGRHAAKADREEAGMGSYLGGPMPREFWEELGDKGLPPKPRARNNPSLTPRESQVIQLVAGGWKNHEIASKLGVATRTVESHRWRAMEKLNLHSEADVVRAFLNKEVRT